MEAQDNEPLRKLVLQRLAKGRLVKEITTETGLARAEIVAIRKHAQRVDEAEAEIATVDEKTAPYTPSQEEIRAACEEIQAGWSDHERSKRGIEITDAVLPTVSHGQRWRNNYLTQHGGAS